MDAATVQPVLPVVVQAVTVAPAVEAVAVAFFADLAVADLPVEWSYIAAQVAAWDLAAVSDRELAWALRVAVAVESSAVDQVAVEVDPAAAAVRNIDRIRRRWRIGDSTNYAIGVGEVWPRSFFKLSWRDVMTVQRLIKPAVSCLIAGHILAIFVSPASVPPTSPLIDSTWAACSPYLHATNLNNGYHFFAPEPGYSTLLEYVGRNAQGELTHGVFPNQQTMRPRLLYHRYFMLTEFLGSFDEKDPLRQSVVQDFAAQLLREKQLVQVDLTLVRHHPSSRQAILIGNPLDSTESYEREELGTYTWDSLPQPRSL